MRANRKVIAARPDSLSSPTLSPASAPASISKLQKVRDLFTSLSSFVRRFENIDPSAFDLSSSIIAFSSEFLIAVQLHLHESRFELNDFEDRWTELRSELLTFIDAINQVQLSDLCTTEFDALEKTIDRVNALPPTTPSLLRDHKKSYQALKNSLQTARTFLASGQTDLLKAHLRQIRASITHQHEAFFKVSQIDKSWKKMVGVECRRRLDQSLALLDLAPELGALSPPATVDEIAELFDGFRPPRIARPSPPPDDPESAPKSPIAQKVPVSDSELSDDAFFSTHESAEVASPTANRFVADLSDIEIVEEEVSDGIVSELRAFEGRFARYVAAVGASELLTRFMNELRVTQRLILTGVSDVKDHFARLKTLIGQVEQKVPVAQPLFQSENRFELLAAAVADLRGLIGGTHCVDRGKVEEAVQGLARRWQAVLEPEARAEAGGLAALVDDELRPLERVAHGQFGTRAQLVAEMRAVQTRIVALRVEEESATPEELSALGEEFDALFDQEADLAERMGALV
jgi:hypothetical protein